MRKRFSVIAAVAMLFATSVTGAEKADAMDMYDWIDALSGSWSLSAPEKQEGTESYKHKAIVHLAGDTSKPGIVFKSIGRKSTVEERLLPDTDKEMVTMYHCKDIACNDLKATHYCVKQNQPEFIADLSQSSDHRIIFNCDMSTELCNSDEDHVHTIIHEISPDGKHLKSSYLSLKDKKPVANSSIYHFDRMETPAKK